MLLQQLPSALQVWWGANHYAHALPESRGWIFWDKATSGDFADGELAWTNLDRPVRVFRHRWNGMLRDSEAESARSHPTQKPVALYSWLIASLDINGTIIDPFLGAGASLVAARSYGLAAIGIEIEERYCEIAANRLAQSPLDFGEPTCEQEAAQVQLGMDELLTEDDTAA